MLHSLNCDIVIKSVGELSLDKAEQESLAG